MNDTAVRPRPHRQRRVRLAVGAALLCSVAAVATVVVVRGADYIPSKQLWIAAGQGDVEYLRAAVARKPDSAFRWLTLCQGYSTAGEYERAADACRRSLELDPNNEYAVFTTGVVAVCSGDAVTLSSMQARLHAMGSKATEDLEEVRASGCDHRPPSGR
jgi:hypothetical protein